MRRASAASRILAVAAALAASGCPAPDESARTHAADWRDEVIYQLVTDRFANGDPSNDDVDGVGPIEGDFSRFQGGDFRGVEAHLDDLEALGVTTIWISPITRVVARTPSADGYHGYWPSDQSAIEPRFGSEEELVQLVASAHARGLHVLVDVVLNHTGRVFFYDLDGDGAPSEGEWEPPYRASGYDAPIVFVEPARLFAPLPRALEGDLASELAPAVLPLDASHFHRRGAGALSIPEERRYGDFPDGLRDLDTESEAVVDALVQTWVTWALRLDLDGLRLDAVPHAEVAFWRAFASRVRSRLAALGKRRFFLLGEIFETDPRDVVPYVSADALDAGFDIPLKHALVDGVLASGNAPASAVLALEGARSLFRDSPQTNGIGLDPWQARVALIDNHDTGRLRAFVDDPFVVDQALVLVFTIDAIPSIYYGTEQELAGPGGHACREPLWLAGYGRDRPTFSLIALLSRLRRTSRVLRYGTLSVRFASEHGARGEDGLPSEGEADAGLLAYERAFEGEHVLVALNSHPTQASHARFSTTLSSGRYRDALEGEATLDVAEGGAVELEVPPRRSRIFVRER